MVIRITQTRSFECLSCVANCFTDEDFKDGTKIYKDLMIHKEALQMLDASLIRSQLSINARFF